MSARNVTKPAASGFFAGRPVTVVISDTASGSSRGPMRVIPKAAANATVIAMRCQRTSDAKPRAPSSCQTGQRLNALMIALTDAIA